MQGCAVLRVQLDSPEVARGNLQAIQGRKQPVLDHDLCTGGWRGNDPRVVLLLTLGCYFGCRLLQCKKLLASCRSRRGLLSTEVWADLLVCLVASSSQTSTGAVALWNGASCRPPRRRGWRLITPKLESGRAKMPCQRRCRSRLFADGTCGARICCRPGRVHPGLLAIHAGGGVPVGSGILSAAGEADAITRNAESWGSGA